MNTRWIAVILVIALMGTVSGCTTTGGPVLAIGSYDMTAVTSYMKSVVSTTNGLALVVIRNGKIIERAGAGRVGTGTVVDIGSSSRWLAAAAMMTLVDQGLISLDDPVSKYLPEFTGDKTAITIRQLWSQTSGLPLTDVSLAERTITLDACVQRLATLPLLTTPGTTVNDGAVAMQVGARICEVVSGLTWQEFFRRQIAAPLGMDDTSFDMPGFSRNPFVAGAARSTADDYARFLTMLLQRGMWNGKRILSENAVAQIEQDQSGVLPVLQTPFTAFSTLLPETLQAHPGLGMWREEIDAASGALILASCPGTYGFMPWIDFSRNLAGVLSMKDNLAHDAGICVQVRQLVNAGIAAGPRFRDVPSTSWAYASVVDLSARGLIGGYEDGTFHPDEAVTRAQFARLICLIQKVTVQTVTRNPFPDVAASHWAAGYIAAAVQQGFLSGYRNGTFHPDDPLTTAQALVVVVRLGGWSGSTAAGLPYTDVPAAFWARIPITTCFAHGVVKDPDPGIVRGGKLNPDAHCTRAQVCVFLSRLLAAGR